MRIFIAGCAVILAGAGGYVFGKSSVRPPAERVDEIGEVLPEGMVAAIRDEKKRETLLSVWEQVAPAINGPSVAEQAVQTEAARAALAALPEGVEAPRFALRLPGENVGWPETEALIGGEALDAAKAGWVVMNIWATWCAPCVAELPDIQAAATALGNDNITLLTINADTTGKDTPEIARQTLARRDAADLPFIMVEDKDSVEQFLGEIFHDVDSQSFPYTVIYAPGGVPFVTFSGGVTTDEAVWLSEVGLAFFRGLAASTPR